MTPDRIAARRELESRDLGIWTLFMKRIPVRLSAIDCRSSSKLQMETYEIANFAPRGRGQALVKANDGVS